MTDQKEKLLQAFNHMVDEMHTAIEKAEEALAPTIDDMVKNAEKLSKQAYALTQDEIQLISNNLKRDIAHAQEYMQTEGKELNQWLKFDMQLVEDKFADFLSQAADKSWIDFHAFQEGKPNTLYKTGEICGSGTLRCLSCQQEMTFTKNSHIPPCPKCHETEFERIVG